MVPHADMNRKQTLTSGFRNTGNYTLTADVGANIVIINNLPLQLPRTDDIIYGANVSTMHMSTACLFAALVNQENIDNYCF